MSATSLILDPASLTAFTATLSALPREEIRKAKILYIRNAIADFELQKSSAKTGVILVGIMSIIPVFLLILIPTLIMYRKTVKTGHQKIQNAIEVWRDDLGEEADAMISQIWQ